MYLSIFALLKIAGIIFCGGSSAKEILMYVPVFMQTYINSYFLQFYMTIMSCLETTGYKINLPSLVIYFTFGLNLN